MAQDWRATAKTVVVTAMLTSVFWFAAAAWWYQHTVAANGNQPHQDTGQSFQASAKPGAKVEEPKADQRTIDEGQLVIPVVGVKPEQLTDTFSQARASGARHHDAIDIMAPRGATVVAAAPGRVEKLFLSRDGGNTVYVRSPDGRTIYYYAHLDGYAPTLVEGMSVQRGTPLGTVGSTGNANPAAPHLHFAIWQTTPDKKWWEDATALNPYPVLKQSQMSGAANFSPYP